LPGGVRVVFTVRERYYLLAYPRLSANLDGQTSYGGEVDWTNMFGLNYGLEAKVSASDRREANRGRETDYTLGFSAPFIFDSRYSLSLELSHNLSPVQDTVSYDETFDSAQAVVTRKLSGDGPASQGWMAGAGLLWQNENRAGPGVPQAYGESTAPLLQASYYDIRDRIFSAEGVAYGARIAGARRGLASEYNYSTLTLNYRRLMAVGQTEHQDINVYGYAGVYFDGPPEVHNFALGGSSALRAYNANFIEGNAYYLLRGEYLRPLGWPWLRGALILEAGNTFENARAFTLNRVYTSLGAALRVRLPLFVNLQLEVGYAVPLQGGGGRFFGGRV
ncbi:MAG TPA: BamA/TamA family outer membrane protein, partial [Nevskiaceae bacterium]|nr:BamA/TamA family outer membrane protein [Nevskiaceae bacterium]